MLVKIKEFFGICTAQKGLCRSKYEVDIKELKIKRYLCKKHAEKLMDTLLINSTGNKIDV